MILHIEQQTPIISLDGKPETLTEVVYTTILDVIMNRVLPPGARVTESSLAKQLQVSKTPVREAFLRLREIGLLEPYGARGSRVVGPSIDTLRHAFEMREALESFTAEMASSRTEPDAVEKIAEAARLTLAYAQAGELDKFQAQDRAFHQRIAAAAGNPRVGKAIDDAGVLVRTLRQRDVPDTHDLVACGESHVRIAEAIQARDGERASREMRSHIQQVEEYVFASWDKSAGS
jgi:GntR family transcriptional regulator, rspAB operon transcriptional repressor